MTKKERDKIVESKLKILKSYASALSELGLNVKIFVNWNENGETFGLNIGRGNMYALDAQLREYFKEQTFQEQIQLQQFILGDSDDREDCF